MRDTVCKIEEEANHCEETVELRGKLDDENQMYEDLKSRVELQRNMMGTLLAENDKYNADVGQFQNWLASKRLEVDEFKPIILEKSWLSEQLENVKVCFVQMLGNG